MMRISSVWGGNHDAESRKFHRFFLSPAASHLMPNMGKEKLFLRNHPSALMFFDPCHMRGEGGRKKVYRHRPQLKWEIRSIFLAHFSFPSVAWQGWELNFRFVVAFFWLVSSINFNLEPKAQQKCMDECNLGGKSETMTAAKTFVRCMSSRRVPDIFERGMTAGHFKGIFKVLLLKLWKLSNEFVAVFVGELLFLGKIVWQTAKNFVFLLIHLPMLSAICEANLPIVVYYYRWMTWKKLSIFKPETDKKHKPSQFSQTKRSRTANCLPNLCITTINKCFLLLFSFSFHPNSLHASWLKMISLSSFTRLCHRAVEKQARSIIIYVVANRCRH